MTARDLETHRNTLQALVSSLGRDDIGVGEVSQENGRLRFTLTRGEHSHTDEIPIDVLADRERAMAKLMAILPKISKPIEEKHLGSSTSA